MIRSVALTAGAAGSIALLATGLPAQSPKTAGSEAVAGRIVDDMTACRTIAQDAARLACFDRTVAAFETARTANQLRVIDREDIKRTKRSLFGLSMPRLNLFGGGDNAEPEITEIDGVVRTVREMAHGLTIVILEDGSQWQFTEQVTLQPRAGDPIHIKRGALGSYFGSVKKRVPLRIKRIG